MDWEAQPFRNSLSALALIAMREVRAEGYAYFGRDINTGVVDRLDSRGVAIPDSRLADSTGVRVYVLGSYGGMEGFLAFAFSSTVPLADSADRLERMVGTIRMVWAASESAGHYSDLIGRVSELETRLLDAKIADRAHGFLMTASKADLSGAISKHVDSILRPTETMRLLENIVQQLER